MPILFLTSVFLTLSSRYTAVAVSLLMYERPAGGVIVHYSEPYIKTGRYFFLILNIWYRTLHQLFYFHIDKPKFSPWIPVCWTSSRSNWYGFTNCRHIHIIYKSRISFSLAKLLLCKLQFIDVFYCTSPGLWLDLRTFLRITLWLFCTILVTKIFRPTGWINVAPSRPIWKRKKTLFLPVEWLAIAIC